jgi:mycofactocin precursor
MEITPTRADAARPEQEPEHQGAAVPDGNPPLDLSRLAPPENLEEVRLEELTIDGICGVY